MFRIFRTDFILLCAYSAIKYIYSCELARYREWQAEGGRFFRGQRLRDTWRHVSILLHGHQAIQALDGHATWAADRKHSLRVFLVCTLALFSSLPVLSKMQPVGVTMFEVHVHGSLCWDLQATLTVDLCFCQTASSGEINEHWLIQIQTRNTYQLCVSWYLLGLQKFKTSDTST